MNNINAGIFKAKNILVAIDGINDCMRLISTALDLAKVFSSNLWLVHVAESDPDFAGYEISPPEERSRIAKQFHEEHIELQKISESLRESGINTTAIMLQGSIVEKLISEAERLDSDLLIMGYNTHEKLKHLITGNVTIDVIKKSGIPLLVVPNH